MITFLSLMYIVSKSPIRPYWSISHSLCVVLQLLSIIDSSDLLFYSDEHARICVGYFIHILFTQLDQSLIILIPVIFFMFPNASVIFFSTSLTACICTYNYLMCRINLFRYFTHCVENIVCIYIAIIMIVCFLPDIY